MIQEKTVRLGGIFIFLILAFALVFQAGLVNADMQVVNYNITHVGDSSGAKFVAQTLKYEPYPVNAGDWFDLWIKVQNTGQDDAPNARFEIIPEYPFYSNDSLVREYNLIPGTSTAFRNKQLGDKDIQANQVIMKFRVKAADSAPKGESLIKLQTSADNSGYGFIYSLPIEIGKTKTDFDIVMQDSTSQGTSFAIANVGDNSATAVTFTIPSQEYVQITGPSSSIIGNLEKGDFTTINFQILPNKDLHELNAELAYTDSAGVRNTINKTIPVNINSAFGQQTQASGGFGISSILYITLGIFLGIFGNFLYRRRKKKRE